MSNLKLVWSEQNASLQPGSGTNYIEMPGNVEKIKPTGDDALFINKEWLPRDSQEEIISELVALYAETNEKNWDGDGAEPIGIKTLLNANEFILSMFFWVRKPEIFTDPEGYIAFEWYQNKKTFTALIGSTNKIHYWGLYSENTNFSGIWQPTGNETIENFFNDMKRNIQKIYD